MLQFTRRVLAFLKIANWVVGIALILLVAVFGFLMPGRAVAALGKAYPELNPSVIITFVGITLVMLPVVTVLVHLIFRALLEMIDTIPQNQVFTDANADRLRRIAWALLGFCIVDHVYGIISQRYVSSLAQWNPTLSGWLVSLLLFVLASVWKQGVEMRVELEGTV